MGGFKKGNDYGNRFSKDNQPSKEKRGMGQKKRWTRMDLIKLMMEQKPSDKLLDSVQYLLDKLQIDRAIVTNELLMHLKQLEKAIQEGDTRAFTAVLDRFVGKPKQEIEQTGENNINLDILGWLPPDARDDNGEKEE